MSPTGQALLDRVRAAFPGATTRQVFPFLRVRVQSDTFRGMSDDEREIAFAEELDLDLADLRAASERLFLRFELLADGSEDPTPLKENGSTWLGTFADGPRRIEPATGTPPVLHFYGFKGGQGRTTFLAFLANEIARDGLRVLAVDLDAEAPSLDLALGVGAIPPEATLLGLRMGLVVSPLAVSAPRGGGAVALLAFRPSDREFDLDSTALAFEAAVHAPSTESLARKLRDEVVGGYDLILLDHRTGLGPTVPSWVRTLPGPVVVFDRLDGQSARAMRDVERIWLGLENPGVIVSYVPANLPVDSFREQRRGDAWPWFDALARARSERAEEELGAEDVEDHWILWPDDNAFRRKGLPQRDEVGGQTRDSIARLREATGLTSRREQRELPSQLLHPSGATDQGLFIATEALRDLCQRASPIRFVFGRKGTGKTRLLSELARRGVGEPLVVAEDEMAGGLPSGDVDLKAMLATAQKRGDLECLWWTLIGIALAGPTTNSERLRSALDPRRKSFANGADVRKLARSVEGGPRVFLIDGLETMSNRAETRELIQALFRVASALEQDAVLRARVSVRIFLRSDIARWGFENFEQQSHGKSIELTWSTQAIFNFVLSRLPHLPWFARTFPDVVRHVTNNAAEIEQGAMGADKCMDQLLHVFPGKMGRLNLNTSTFLRTYFSDDPSGEVSYYPRVYHAFLESIDRSQAPLDGGRVRQDVILRAHDEASEAFLAQVRQELRFLTPLKDSDLDRLINALKGQGTPFVARALRREIRNSLKFPLPDIEAAFDAMKEIGMFEQHPKLADQWRVGRLFKSALKMKYRGGASG